jgi:hypothetical protein
MVVNFSVISGSRAHKPLHRFRAQMYCQLHPLGEAFVVPARSRRPREAPEQV